MLAGLPFVLTDGANVERPGSFALRVDARAVIRETIALGPHDPEFDALGAMARHLSGHTHGSPLDPVWDAWVVDARVNDGPAEA